MAYGIDELEGIGAAYAEKLGSAGIKDTDDLLSVCGSADGRAKTAEKAGVSEKRLLSWVNLADLMRISGIGPQYSELLEAAGVDTVKELRTRNAANLAAKLAEVNGEKKLAKSVPSESVVQGWIDAAKGVEPRVTH